MRFLKRTRGFSLFELLLVLTLTAILMGLAFPSWRLQSKKVESQILLTQLQEALRFARQQALLRHEKIVLCGSHDQETCTADWRQGLVVMSMRKESLHAFRWGRLNGVLHWRAFSRSPNQLEFLPSGATNYENGTFWYCSNTAIYPAWALGLSQSGHWHPRYPDSNGHLQNRKGQQLMCDTASRDF